jgi:hypothetical protein
MPVTPRPRPGARAASIVCNVAPIHSNPRGRAAVRRRPAHTARAARTLAEPRNPMQVETNDYLELKSEILDGMRSYREDLAQDGADAGYSDGEIDECERIIDRFLDAIVAAQGDRVAGRAAIKQAVLALNALNARCGYNLIETDQREGLCELILGAAAQAGAVQGEEDITEQWREW